jgi:hypothetical protein
MMFNDNSRHSEVLVSYLIVSICLDGFSYDFLGGVLETEPRLVC